MTGGAILLLAFFAGVSWKISVDISNEPKDDREHEFKRVLIPYSFFMLFIAGALYLAT